MPKFIDLTGQTFGRLTVIERAENDKHGFACWKCRCECNAEVIVSGNHLRSGHSTSCGCRNREKASKRLTIHGLRHTKIYGVWNGIKDRCFNPNNKFYKHYGGRGITMYPEWVNDFQAFYKYVSKLEHFGEPDYSLDRIDNNGNYEPKNLHWVDWKNQNRNRRNTIMIEYEGVEMTLAEAAEKSGIKYETLRRRYHRGDRKDKLFRPIKNRS